MLLACIDTSTPVLSLALCEAGGGGLAVLAEAREEARSSGHGARLPAALTELLAARGLASGDVGAWVCGLGPGSFTGLRIGLATWKGFAYAHRRPLLGASSLAALARAALPLAPPGALLVPLLDARKGEVYAGFFRAGPDGLIEPAAPEVALAPELLAARAAELPGALVFGQGLAAYAERLAGLPPGARLAGAPATPPAAALARLVLPRLGAAAFEPAQVFALEPHYVRASEAEVKFPAGLPGRPPV